MHTPRDFSSATTEELSNIRVVCFDIDDTFSSEGKITGEAYQSLWSLKRKGYALIPVTGRCAGWCDHIARFWPVDAVVGENGAFVFYMDQGRRHRVDTLSNGHELKEKLKTLHQKILKEFPHALVASDQEYREYDLAIDICEDVPQWSESDINHLLDFCRNEGAIAKLSSIHVNTWFGQYDKTKGLETFRNLKRPGIDPDFSKWIFLGDSPNDAPLFGHFKTSVGVANIKKYLGKLEHLPTFITSGKSGVGFCEVAKTLCKEW